MKCVKAIIMLAVLLVLSANVISGVVNAQSATVSQSGNPVYTDNGYIPVCHDNEANGMPAAPAYVDETASGQSIIFNNGVPTTVISASGVQTQYNPSMWDFLAGYTSSGPYGVGISSNPNVPSGGTWKQVVESGSFGTQEPNLSLN